MVKAQNIKDSIDMTREFIELWVKFNQIYKEAMGKTSITPEEEKSFLETKSIIARKFQVLADSLLIDRPTMERTYDVIGHILSLKSISTLAEPELKKLESDWHQSYISLNRLQGHLEAQKGGAVAGGSPLRMSNPVVKYLIYAGGILLFILALAFIGYVLFGGRK